MNIFRLTATWLILTSIFMQKCWGVESQFHTVRIHHHEFKLEVSSTDAQRRQGLMYRQSLAPQQGMLFFFSDGEKISMWMKNTYIPLDMLFVQPDGKIACIIKDTKPRSLKFLTCNAKVMAVIELNAGDAEKFHINEGDMVNNLRKFFVAFV
jgi:uncharacterized membrane protein (UPF0127 family)